MSKESSSYQSSFFFNPLLLLMLLIFSVCWFTEREREKFFREGATPNMVPSTMQHTLTFPFI